MDLDLFISENLEGYMKVDIRVLMDTKSDEATGYGGLNFPLALYIFSCMDYLGFLTSKDKYSPSGDTKNRIMAFIEQFFPQNSIDQIHKLEDVFVNYFRHGLTHEYFPKAASGISKEEGDLFQKGKGEVLILNSYALGEIFNQSIDTLINKIRNDTELSNRILERMSIIEKDHLNNARKLTNTGFISTLNDNLAGASGVGASLNSSLGSWFKDENDKN